MQSKNKIYAIYSRYINIIRMGIINTLSYLENIKREYNRQRLDDLYINISISNYVNINVKKLINSNINDKIDLLTIAFNNSETIKTQYKFLRMYLKDTFNYIVVDNSTKKEISKIIKNYCKLQNIPYVRLLNNPYNGKDPSRSHGIALNWAYQNIIKHSGSSYFGTLDHDIYPVKKTSILQNLKLNKIWGHMQVRENGWYIWPGFSFFDKKILNDDNVNFLPAPGLDTGGSNWKSIYIHINPNSINLPPHQYIRYKKGNIIQNTCVERIGDWIHLINASGWKDGKEKANIKTFLDSILKK